MHLLNRSLLTLAVVALVASPALAQRQRPQGGAGGFGFGGRGLAGVQLLGNKSVQEELKITDEQKEKITPVLTKISEKQRDAFGKLRDLSAEERREKMQELQKEMTAMNEQGLKDVMPILTTDQTKRFKQIQIQVRGLEAYSDPEVVSALKLTDEQKDDIKKVNEEMAKQMREMFQPGGGGNFQEAQRKMTALRKETNEKVQSMLTDAQKKTLKELRGEAFELKIDAPRRPQQQ